MQRVQRILLLAVIIFLMSTSVGQAFASSSYVLPYPSTMPGGINYKIRVLWEKILTYWYFGDFGQFEYNLKESDKYLVESKTLFDYNQYLLGFQALQKSNIYFANILPHLLSAKSHGKDITDKKKLLQQASAKHIEVLQQMESSTPQEFTWNPEKSAASKLHIHALIDQSVQLRQKDL